MFHIYIYIYIGMCRIGHRSYVCAAQIPIVEGYLFVRKTFREASWAAAACFLLLATSKHGIKG